MPQKENSMKALKYKKKKKIPNILYVHTTETNPDLG